MSTQEQRERFEGFAIRRNMGTERISCGRYKSSFTQAMFESWLAAEAATIESIAAWIEPQRNDVPANGKEFASAIRAILQKEGL